MSFPEKTRQWWLRVWGDDEANEASCQKLFIQKIKAFTEIAEGAGSMLPK